MFYDSCGVPVSVFFFQTFLTLFFIYLVQQGYFSTRKNSLMDIYGILSGRWDGGAVTVPGT